MSFLDRHADRTDRYVDALLAADRATGDVPADARLDPEIRRAAARLRAALVRVHPSFRFEERLANELALVAAGEARVRLAHALPAVGDAEPVTGEALSAIGVNVSAPFGVQFAVPQGAVRPIVVGAALSLGGAAFFAWRRTRPQAGLTRPHWIIRGARGETA